MANWNSDQEANAIATPMTKNRANDLAGRMRIAYASYTTPSSAGPAAGDNLVLFKLNRGTRILQIDLIVPASYVTSSAKIGYGVLNADGTINTVINSTAYGSGVDLSTTGRKPFILTAAAVDYKLLELTSTTDASYTAYNEAAIILNWVTGNPGVSLQIAAFAYYVID